MTESSARLELWDANEVRKRLKLKSIESVRNLVQSRGLPHVRVGRSLKFYPPAVEQWIADQVQAHPVSG